jgi:hypothetical protein
MINDQVSVVAVLTVPTHDTMPQVMVISRLEISNPIPVPIDPMPKTPWGSPYPCYSLGVGMGVVVVGGDKVVMVVEA